MRHIVAIKQHKRGVVVVLRRADRPARIQRNHALAPLLAALCPILAFAVEVVDLLFGQAL